MNTLLNIINIVFSSSIFFMAFSVATGLKITEYLSNPSYFGAFVLKDLAYFGFLANFNVFGL